MHVLVTGGAGFIGSHLVDRLLARGHAVRVLDNLDTQVHGPQPNTPDYLSTRAELMHGDVRDGACLRRALSGAHSVVHLAALVGARQSMYRLGDYTDVNVVGTARLLETAVEMGIRRVVVASCMSIYGEGLYHAGGRPVEDAERNGADLRSGRWEPRSRAHGAELVPMPTPEHKRPQLESVYAVSKFDQERLAMMVGRAYDIETVTLRLFNVYGPRQALSNPSTGALAIFAARYLDDKPPLIFEDGQQRRDFVNVHDVARACELALTVPQAAGEVLNIGSGRPMTILEAAQRMGKALGKSHIEPIVTRRSRAGDVRHCFGDISRARKVLGFEPQASFESGLGELTRWLRRQAPSDRVERAYDALRTRGLTL